MKCIAATTLFRYPAQSTTDLKLISLSPCIPKVRRNGQHADFLLAGKQVYGIQTTNMVDRNKTGLIYTDRPILVVIFNVAPI